MMAGKRKKKGRPRLPPRCKRMKREKRLKAAKAWIPQYEGKNLVKEYRKHFGVDILCAIKELQMLGIEFSDSYIEQVKRTVESQREQRQREKIEKEQQPYLDSDDTFADIGGYTSGGFPYGVTWEELSETLTIVKGTRHL